LDDPVEFDKFLNYSKIQPIQGNGYWYNHSPDVVTDTNISGKLTDNKGFRYKKPVQPVLYKKPTVLPLDDYDQDYLKKQGITNVIGRTPFKYNRNKGVNDFDRQYEYVYSDAPETVLKSRNRMNQELMEITPGVPELMQGPNVQVQQRPIQNLPYQVDWRMGNEDRTNYFVNEEEGAKFLAELNPVTGLPEYRNRGDYNASGRYTVADKLRGLEQGGELHKAEVGVNVTGDCPTGHFKDANGNCVSLTSRNQQQALSDKTRVARRDYEGERASNFRKAVASQPQLKQGRPETQYEAAVRKYKNQGAVAKNPNAVVNTQGDIVPKYADTDVKGRVIDRQANTQRRMQNTAAAVASPFVGAAAVMGAGAAGAATIPYIAPALNAPLLGTFGSQYGTAAITGQNLLGLGFGLKGASNLGGDVDSGYYSSDAPLSEKVDRGLITAMDMAFSPGVTKALGMGYGAAKNSFIKSSQEVPKPTSISSSVDDVVSNSGNQLPPPPREIILDEHTINLERQSPKTKKKMPSFDDIDIGSGLTLRNNPSRVENVENILGKKRNIKSVINKETGESIDLKTWQDDDGQLYYYMSASMPSSKIKAGKAYLEIEKHIPKGASLLENSSLSYDSFLNILKQTKNPKFETFVKGNIPMNNSAKNAAFKTKPRETAPLVEFANKNHAEDAVNELNLLLDKYNLPQANVVNEYGNYSIQLPNIGLKKLYSIIGIGGAGVASSQVEEQRKGGVIKDDRGQWAHPGEITQINSPYITMEGVSYPVLGIADTGEEQMMYPGQDYEFEGAEYVTEYPKGKLPKKAKNGVNQADENSLVQLDQLTNFTNYNKPTKGGWLDKY
jgi:hypothetical protein